MKKATAISLAFTKRSNIDAAFKDPIVRELRCIMTLARTASCFDSIQRRSLAGALTSIVVLGAVLQAGEPTASLYHWQPVRLGAGGFVTGFVTHPLDANVRYCRTDVGNAYRWDGREWRPIIVRAGDKGMPADLAATPVVCGVDSIAIDPARKGTVLLTMNAGRPDMLKNNHAPLGGNVYKSTDGGVKFTAGTLSLAMEPNGPWRTEGERLKVDPNNSEVVFYGSLKDGLWRSHDGGANWTVVKGGGAPAVSANVLGVHFASASGTVVRDRTKCSRTIFAVVPRGSVFSSLDGGATWNNISAATKLDGTCMFSTLDTSGTLHVVSGGSRDLWSWRNGRWRTVRVELDWARAPHAVGFDPGNPARLFAISDGGGLSRSLDAGKTWTMFGPDMVFANRLGWLPQKTGWRSNAGIIVDRDGVCWIPQGNEGVLRWKATGKDQEDAKNPPRWTIDSVGIEEFVTHDVIMPPGGDAVFAVEDATGLVTADTGKFAARQIPLQDQLISNGTGLAFCPNAPEFLTVVTADVHHTGSGKSYSGFSADSGRTWTRFAGLPVDPSTGNALQAAGSIAISRRGGWKTGGDHLVWLPTGDGPSHYSHDGGKSWKPSAGFPIKSGYWIFALKQRSLAADPFTPDKFYFVASWAGGFYVSTDGGKSWQQQHKAGLSSLNHHSQLAVNRAVNNDLWFCDGWDGANEHGLWHSTNGGRSFTKLDGIEYAITLCLGAGSPKSKDSKCAVYFYGKLAASPDWGIFRSTDAGATWQRVSYYPSGIVDQPTCMAASWDHFAEVIVGFGGNSFVKGAAEK
jgi:BNR/Asp-box repeat